MSQKSKLKNDKRKAEAKKTARRKAATKQLNFDDPIALQKAFERLFSPALLTTPTVITPEISKAAAKISDIAPFFLAVSPELWSRQGCCDRNVAEYIKLHGGQIVCGYRAWYNEPNYLELERHAIWNKGDQYRDVSFSSDGETRIFFIPDIPDKQGRLRDNELRVRIGFDYETKKLIKLYSDLERKHLHIQHMEDDEAWNTMLTYEEWVAGKRMSAMLSVDPLTGRATTPSADASN